MSDTPSPPNIKHAEDALLREQFWMLAKQNPTGYLINAFCITLLVYIYSDATPAYTTLPVWLMLMIVAANRGYYWWRASRRPSVSIEEMRSRVATIPTISGALSMGLSVWIMLLIQNGDEHHQTVAVAYLCISTFLIMTVNSYVPIAKVVIATGGVPIIGWLLLQGSATHLAIAVMYAASLAAITIQSRRQYETFANMISLRFTAERSQKHAEAARQKLLDVANTDPLTELYNRRAFLNAINRRIREGDKGFVLALIDLDGFKPVNDIYGHAAGDEVLRCVAKRLKSAIGEDGIAARIGGDEFGFLLKGSIKTSAVRKISQAAVDTIGRPITLSEGPLVNISACCGMARQDSDTQKANILLERADQALYQSKRSGRGTISVYDDNLKARISRRGDIEKRLTKAIQNDTFSIAYQPICSLTSDRITSFEALARWNDDELGTVPPDEFIPIAEQTGLIIPLSQKLFKMALSDAANWPTEIKLSFNVSPVQFLSPGFALHTLLNLSNQHFPADRLILEITETTLLSNSDRARTAINHLNAAGVAIALDDFGTGYASFGYLDKLNFDKLKIDRSLVATAETDKKKRAILKAIIEMCRILDITCVAEGI